jgi:hypothetical protein
LRHGATVVWIELACIEDSVHDGGEGAVELGPIGYHGLLVDDDSREVEPQPLTIVMFITNARVRLCLLRRARGGEQCQPIERAFNQVGESCRCAC